MAKFFENNIEDTEYLLYLILEDDKIRVEKVIGQRDRYLKFNEGGVNEMCELMEALAREEAEKAAKKAAKKAGIKFAEKSLNKGYSVDDVSEITGLCREEVEAIAKRLGKLIA